MLAETGSFDVLLWYWVILGIGYIFIYMDDRECIFMIIMVMVIVVIIIVIIIVIIAPIAIVDMMVAIIIIILGGRSIWVLIKSSSKRNVSSENREA